MTTTIVINGHDVIKYLKLKEQGFKTLWTGEGKICLIKKSDTEVK